MHMNRLVIGYPGILTAVCDPTKYSAKYTELYLPQVNNLRE